MDENEYFADGLTELIIESLSQLPHVRVMARSTVFRYKGSEIDPLTAGSELQVSAVVVGQVRKRGDLINLGLELVDVRDGSQLWDLPLMTVTAPTSSTCRIRSLETLQKSYKSGCN